MDFIFDAIEAVAIFAGALVMAYSVPYAIARGICSGISDGRTWSIAKYAVRLNKIKRSEQE